MKRLNEWLRIAAVSGTALAASLSHVHAEDSDDHRRHDSYKHVLLISVDGFHAIDLKNYVVAHPRSNLADLSRHGVTYPNAMTSAPSDSFPGLLAQITGGTSKSHGVFYDVSYDRTLFAPGSNCEGAPGTVTTYDESIDIDPTSYTAGGTLGQPLTQLDATKLPLALVGGKCVAVYPHEFIKVNTIFEVIRAAGHHTAWADKHPTYDIVNGPSGKGVEDLFTPEVNSNDSVTRADTTKGFHSVQRNDLRKVEAVLNEITGLDSTGKSKVGVPTIFGMNFQAVSVGQKLATGNSADKDDDGLVGGYADAAGRTPNNGLRSGLDFVDGQIGAFVAALKKAHIYADTLIIISAKHGQSPIDHALRKQVDDGPYGATPGVAQVTDDDVALVWLKPGQSQWLNYFPARRYLNGQKTPLGIVELLDRDELTKLYNDPFHDSRTPDFIAITSHGLIYTSGSKLAEHGGFAHDDRNVALLVSNPFIDARTIYDEVETRQIAPTILLALGLDPDALKAVRLEHTKRLPGDLF